MRAATIDIGTEVNYVDYGGAGEPIVLVHGLGGSVENWMAAGPLLTEWGRVLALDLGGFGRTALPEGKGGAVDDNRALLDRFLDEMAGGPATLIGNSMGGMISILETAAEPHKISRLVLADPAVPIPEDAEVDPVVQFLFATYATPGTGEEFVEDRLAELGPEQMTRMTLELCCVDVERVPAEVVEAHIALSRERAGMEWATRAFLDAARSVMTTIAEPAYTESIRDIAAPTLVVYGDCDRLITRAAIEALAVLRPDWTLEILDGVGHTPMLEDPTRFASVVGAWLEERG
jgi:pimeloyl-ACP methyl ester carboxylesterase